MSESLPTATFKLETAFAESAGPVIAGVDEAGRGPLAGPVTAAAVVFTKNAIPPGLADSKTLSRSRREELYDAIMTQALAVAIGSSPAEEIDEINIRQATFAAMRRAIAGLAMRPDGALIDGREIPPGMSCPAQAIIKGDAKSVSIAAASIVAKVTRDRLMGRLAAACPGYGFERHAGYPTAAHREAITRLGPSRWHRRSFQLLKPV